jgi:hypothetical protein
MWNFQLESSQDALIEILVNQKAKHRRECLRFDKLRAPGADAGAKAIRPEIRGQRSEVSGGAAFTVREALA